MSCPSIDVLYAFAEGTLEPERRDGVEIHLDTCESCRQQVSAAAIARAQGELDDSTTDNMLAAAAADTPPTADARASADSAKAAVLAPGTRVDHYVVGERIGSGGMGEVYRAHDSRLRRDVALKLVRPDLLSSPEVIERFLFEARATARFNHPNIIAIYDVGQHHGRPYVALELLEGETLRQRLRGGALPTREVRRVALAIASALREAHEAGVLHRDLKPSNIFFGADDRVRVLDFGMAKQLGARVPDDAPTTDRQLEVVDVDETFFTAGDGIRGTPLYMAPEQWQSANVDGAADIWALGLVLYEMVWGRHAYRLQARRWTVDDVLQRATLSQPKAGARDAERAQLCEVIDACLRPDPATRPSAAHVAELLARPRGGARRRLGVIGAAAALLVAAAVIFAVATSGGDDPAGAGSARAVDSGAVRAPDSSAARRVASANAEADAATVTGRLSVDAAPASVESKRKRARPRRRPTHAPPPRTASLLVLSNSAGEPMWADVYVDGRLRGRTPLTVRRLARGAHRVVLRRAGFRVVSRRVRLRSGARTRLQITLRRN